MTRKFRTISEHWSKAEFSLRAGGYEDIVPVFQLALTLPIDNACYEREFPAMNDIKTAKATNLISLCLRQYYSPCTERLIISTL